MGRILLGTLLLLIISGSSAEVCAQAWSGREHGGITAVQLQKRLDIVTKYLSSTAAVWPELGAELAFINAKYTWDIGAMTELEFYDAKFDEKLASMRGAEATYYKVRVDQLRTEVTKFALEKQMAAINKLLVLLAVFPNYTRRADVRLELASMYIIQENWSGAYGAAALVVGERTATHKHLATAYLNMGMARMNEYRYDEAIVELQKVLPFTTTRDYIWSLYYTAMVLSKQQRWLEAVQMYDRVLDCSKSCGGDDLTINARKYKNEAIEMMAKR